MSKGFDVFDRTVQKSLHWVDELARDLRVDRHRAYGALRAVLHNLRDRLSPVEATELSAQMPMLLRGLYFEGWSPAGKPTHLKRPEELYAAVRLELSPGATLAEASAAVECVFRLLDNHITLGELEDVRRSLPRGLREIWPPL